MDAGLGDTARGEGGVEDSLSDMSAGGSAGSALLMRIEEVADDG